MKSKKPKAGEEESSEDEAAGELSKVNFIFCHLVEIIKNKLDFFVIELKLKHPPLICLQFIVKGNL